MRVETRELQTVKNYAADMNVAPTYIYRIGREGKIKLVEIDGVYFVNIKKYPELPRVRNINK